MTKLSIKQILSVAVLAAALPLTGKAQVLYTQDFVGPNDTLPAGWSTTNPSVNYILDNQLRVTNVANLTTYTAETFAPSFTATWDMRINNNTISFNDQANNFYFGYDGSRAPEDGPLAYSVGVQSRVANGRLYLSINSGYQARAHITPLATVRLDTLPITFDPDTIYTINVSYDGGTISASMFDGATFIASVSQSDLEELTGNIGFWAVSASFTDSITISAIPEPSTLAFVGALGLLVLVVRRVHLRRKAGA